MGLDSPAFLAAQKACTYLLPFGGGLTGSGTGGTHQQFLQALRVVTCMRSHDYPNWPRRGAKCRKSNERAGRTTAD